MGVDFEREREWWDAKAPKEEQDRGDEPINQALRWREIERHLDGVQSILAVGGGTGAFSIPLARRGHSVTHLDLSPAMLAIARSKAEGLATIRFVEGNAVDLSRFPDASFDLVLNMDGAISFCGSQAERAILESCRVTRRTLMLAVSNRTRIIPVWVGESLRTSQRLVPAVYAMFERGEWHQDAYPENPTLSKGCTQDYFGSFRAFLPAELKRIIEGAGMKVLRIGGLGSLAHLCGVDAIVAAQQDVQVLEEFLDLCERYDQEILTDGPGSRERAGLIAVAERVWPRGEA